MADVPQALHERYLLTIARQEIEDLRRLYCTATDALGRVEDEAARRFGIETYAKIFSPDVTVRVTGTASPLEGTGPDAWVEVVTNALRDYESTQHLIGTQLVEFRDVVFGEADVESGEAVMTSYLHAWHAWPDRKLRLVIGTYTDKVRWYPGTGWQIYDMTLEHTSAEHRMLGDLGSVIT